PGETVRLTIAAKDESGEPVRGAVLGVSVVDDAALSLARSETPTLVTHFLLTSEVQSPEDLEHANFYLSDDAEAEQSIDLLLGTQGWRRFVSGSPDQFSESFRDSLTRLLKLDGNRSGIRDRLVDNEATLMTQLRDYRRQASKAWREFWADLRTLLMVVVGIWLVALLFRSKQRSVAAASLMVLITATLFSAGCGSQEATSQYLDTTTSSAETPEQAFAEGEMLSEEAMMDGGAMGMPGPPGDASETAANQQGSVNRFAQAVLNAFRGDEKRNAALEMISQRLSKDDLKKWQEAQGMRAEVLAQELLQGLRFPIRQYAHLHQSSKTPGTRVDFAETLYWNPIMVTDSSGTVAIEFELSDSITQFQIKVDGHTDNGRIGQGTSSVKTVIPVQVDAKLPLEVSQGDRIDLSVGVVNSTERSQAFELALATETPLTSDKATQPVSLNSGDRDSVVFPIQVGNVAKSRQANVQVSASTKASGVVDQVIRQIKVVPTGYPFAVSRSGRLTDQTDLRVAVPNELVDGSVSATLEILPTLDSQITAGLESMLREPHGCFEQTSSSNYPNVMIYQLLSANGSLDKRTQLRTESLLRRGYRKLVEYECATLGFDWFGNDPGHEALSAFGLMQFSEMASIIDVDDAMMKRTRQWLMDRRDGQGGFQRNPRHLHRWAIAQDYVNAYVLWAISQADQTLGNSTETAEDFAAELDRMQAVADDSSDAYLLSLSALALRNTGRQTASEALLTRLASAQNDDGSVNGQTTITQSGGLSRTVETTSLAVLAWSENPSYKSNVEKAMQWLQGSRRGGGFGSTQATVLALKAMTVAARTPIQKDWELQLLVDGTLVDSFEVNGQAKQESLRWTLSARVVQALVNGNRCELRSSGGEPITFDFQLSGMTLQPESDAACPIALSVELPDEIRRGGVRLGDSVDVGVTLTNKSDQGQPMTMAIVGLPGGLEPVIDSLEQLRDDETIDYYELRGREVILYWRKVEPDAEQQLSIRCIAEVGGEFTG
ncbi:MAG: alpha-2-macroglobulin family protein, partial [Planctomycetota bacterium]